MQPKDGTEVGGNTISPTSKARGYMLTINNPKLSDYNAIKNDDHEYVIYQTEKVTTVHIQGFVYYKNPRSFGAMKKKYPTAHIEIARNVNDCIKYCSKDESRVSGPYENGIRPSQGQRNDLMMIYEDIKKGAKPIDIISKYPDSYIRYTKGITSMMMEMQEDRTGPSIVIWLWGASRTGKTSTVFKTHKSVYVKDGTQWWDKYYQQEAIVIDDFDGKWPFRDLLRLLDYTPYQGQYKGGYVKVNSKYIYITSEFAPEYYYKGTEFTQINNRIKESNGYIKCMNAS